MSDVETEFDPFDEDEEVEEVDAEDDGTLSSVKKLLLAVAAETGGKVPQNAQVSNWTDNNPNFPIEVDLETGQVTYTEESVAWIVAKMRQTRGNKADRYRRQILSNKGKIARFKSRIEAIEAEITELENKIQSEEE